MIFKTHWIGVSSLILSLVWPTSYIQAEELGEAISYSDFRPIPEFFLGVNGNLTAYNAPWTSSAVPDVMNEIGFSSFRYPGGTLANVWDWSEGWLDKNVDLESIKTWMNKKKIINRKNSLDDLAEGYKKVGFLPLFVVNMITSDLSETIQQLKRAEELGLPVVRIELGNEFYHHLTRKHNGSLIQRKFNTPMQYITSANIWAKRIKREFPDCQISVIGEEWHRSFAMKRANNWNRTVIQYMSDDVDAIAFHPYITINAGKYSDVHARNAKYEDVFIDIVNIVRKKVNHINGLGLKSKDVWVTEFNIIDNDKYMKDSWAQSIILSSQLVSYLTQGVVASYYHTLIDGGLFGAAKKGSGVYEYKISGTGIILQLFSKVIKGMEYYSVINKSNKMGEKDILGFVATSEETRRAFIVNTSNDDIHINAILFGSEFCSIVMFGELDSQALNVMPITVTNIGGNLKSTIVVPAYSVVATDTNCSLSSK